MEAQPREIRNYQTADGKEPFAKWLDSLRDMRAIDKIEKRLKRIQSGNLGDYRSVGEGVFEFRIDYGSGYRIYFGQIGLIIILILCGGDKSTQQQDIQKANIGKNMKDVKTATSRSYTEYLIDSLQNPERAAGYIAVMLELDEEGYDAKIFRSALEEVVEARKRSGDFSEAAQHHYEQLDKILAETGGAEILKLIEFLDALGYRINLVEKD